MEPGSFILMDGFELLDAMSVFEVRPSPYLRQHSRLTRRIKIGEPRLDSGFTLNEAPQPPFDPLHPLLPEELCWIMDRAFQYEVVIPKITVIKSP